MSARFGAWIRSRRAALSLSQRELSRKSGVPQTTISHIERAEADPHLSDALALVNALGGTLSEALGITDERSAAMLEAVAALYQLRPDQLPLATAILRAIKDNGR